MERPIFKPLGSKVEELDTPALLVDLDVFESNVKSVHSFFQNQDAKIRPFVGVHRCPALANIQMQHSGHNGGVAVGTVSQAETFIANGFHDTLITGKLVTADKIQLACSLAQRASITVTVDNQENLKDISAIASSRGVNLSVLIEISSPNGFTGVSDSKSALDLAKQVLGSEGTDFQGLILAYSPTMSGTKSDEVIDSIKPLLDVKSLIESNGIPVNTVSAGSTSNYDLIAKVDGVNQVTAGSYALMDVLNSEYQSSLKPAAMVVGTVGSLPRDGLIIGDAGMKTNGNDIGLPRIMNYPDAEIMYLSAEHCYIITTKVKKPIVRGDKLFFQPYDIGVTANLFDFIMLIKNGKLQSILEVTARGRYR